MWKPSSKRRDGSTIRVRQWRRMPTELTSRCDVQAAPGERISGRRRERPDDAGEFWLH